MRKACLVLSLFASLLAGAALAQLPPQDVVTVGTGSGSPGGTVDVPVYIRDTSGTPLGIDQPPGSRIQAYRLEVDYSPAAPVQSVTFTRAGITASLTPVFESAPSGPGTISLLDTFQESTNLVPFTSSATLPGNQVAVLHFTLSPSASPGAIVLTLNPALTQLANEAGTTAESANASNLALVNGSIQVLAAPAPTPTLSTWGLALLGLLALALAAWRFARR